MCILTLITDTSMSARDRAILFNQVMLTSAAQSQPDGWGIFSPSTGIVKQRNEYMYGDMDWRAEVTSHEMLLGHVRSASYNTRITSREAHPFEFNNWVAVHNGSFSPWVKPANPELPESDSYYALEGLDMLESLLNDSNTFDAKLFSTWLSDFDARTVAALIFVDKNGQCARIFRTPEKMLYAIDLGNGFLINTSIDVIRHVHTWCEWMGLNVPFGDTILHVPHNALLTLELGSRAFQRRPIDYQFIPVAPTNRNAVRTLYLPHDEY